MLPQVYLHSLSPSTPPNLILAALQARLPASVTLLQRLETALQDPPHPQHREGNTFLLATFSSEPLPSIGSNSEGNGGPEAHEPFSIALVARTEATDIDVQLFSTIDTLKSPTSDDEKACATQVLALLARFRALAPLPLPFRKATGNGLDSYGGRGQASQCSNEDLILLGCVHGHTAAALRSSSASLLSRFTDSAPSSDAKIAPLIRDGEFGLGGPFNKWIFDVLNTRPTHDGKDKLPEGLEWSTVNPGADREQVIEWNPYVRNPEVLEGLPCAAIRPARDATFSSDTTSSTAKQTQEGADGTGGDLAVWAFRSLDGSVRTVHCMDNWRRRGLAGLVIRQVLREPTRSNESARCKEVPEAHERDDCGITKDGTRPRLGHTNILPGNVASERLFESSVGARRAYDVYWMRVDIGMLTAS